MANQYDDFRDDDREAIRCTYQITIVSNHMRLNTRQKEVLFNMVRRAAQDIHIKMQLAVGPNVEVHAQRSSHSMGADSIDLEQVVEDDGAGMAEPSTPRQEGAHLHHGGNDGW